MKRAQMEMIGLVIIVILITLGLLFLAIFALKSEPDKKVFVRKGLALSTMSSLMKTTVTRSDCTPYSTKQTILTLGREILKDCALHQSLRELPSTYQCNQQHSCAFYQENVEQLLAESLGKWNKKYTFRSYLIVDQRFIDLAVVNPDDCPRTKERDSSGLFPQPTDPGLVESVLYICD